MTDYADDAQDGEATFLAKALAKAQAAPGPAPADIDGVPCCAECGDPIPAARLKALPGTGLCVSCAEELQSSPEDDSDGN